MFRPPGPSSGESQTFSSHTAQQDATHKSKIHHEFCINTIHKNGNKFKNLFKKSNVERMIDSRMIGEVCSMHRRDNEK
jgi:hypothetical protein